MTQKLDRFTDEDSGERRAWYQGTNGQFVVAMVGLVASIPIVALFYIDHLFSCILGQKPELGLKKGEYVMQFPIIIA